MTRIIGTQTITSIWDFYDYDKKGWFRRKAVLERELHATKGWKAERRSRTKNQWHLPYWETRFPRPDDDRSLRMRL